MPDENPASRFPDDRGRFGDYGGKFIPETLMAAVAELEQAYLSAKEDDDFQSRCGVGAGLPERQRGR
jgi:tryptophan synthase beta chain